MITEKSEIPSPGSHSLLVAELDLWPSFLSHLLIPSQTIQIAKQHQISKSSDSTLILSVSLVSFEDPLLFFGVA